MTIEEYRKVPAIHYSALSQMADDPRGLFAEREEKEYFNLGSLVDCMLFTPDRVDSQFFILDTVKPSEGMGNLLDQYLLMGGSQDELSKDVLIAARAVTGYQSGWKEETVATKFWEACSTYMALLMAAGDRTVIGSPMKEKADRLVNLILTHDFTAAIFDPLSTRYKIYPQEPIFWEDEIQPRFKAQYKLDAVGKVPCKSLPDVIVHDLKYDIIFNIDLKVIGQNPKYFPFSHFIKFKYYLQDSFYQKGLEAFVKRENITAQLGLPAFLVVSEGYAPYIWNVTSKWLETGRLGGMGTSGVYHKGYEELMAEFLFHEKTNEYGAPADLQINSGRVAIPDELLR